MRDSEGYGKRDGSSPTAGARSEVIEATMGGATYCKRVFKGQRALTVLQRDESDRPLVQAWPDVAAAAKYILGAHAEDHAVEMYAVASPAEVRDPEERRDLLYVHAGPSAMGRTVDYVGCPFCQREVKTYRWSRCGGGKKCSCGALLCAVSARRAKSDKP